jgi:hypothetical protein
MQPRVVDVLGAGILALVLFALVALIFFATVANADPASMQQALGHAGTA